MKRCLAMVGMLVALTGCHWKAEAEDWKRKWLDESRFHYQTQVIKSAEIAQLRSELDALKAENEALKTKVAGTRPAEAK